MSPYHMCETSWQISRAIRRRRTKLVSAVTSRYSCVSHAGRHVKKGFELYTVCSKDSMGHKVRKWLDAGRTNDPKYSRSNKRVYLGPQQALAPR